MESVEVSPPADREAVGAAARGLLQEAAVCLDGLARAVRGLEELFDAARGSSAGTPESSGGGNFARLIARSRLTHREAEVLHLLLEGFSNRRISRTLQISEPTVKNHMHAIFLKLDVSDRTQAIAKAHRLMPAD
ncbi:MAG TPA: LuxR C-terminal-related transcriptional regulator [Actinocrinis sp.]